MRFSYDALPGKVVFGVGASRELLGGEVAELGAERVLLLFGEPERRLAERICSPFTERIASSFTEIHPHVPIAVAESARAAAAEARADCLLCVGGGSTTGTAKAIAMQLGLPIVAVPTTYAGSEMTPVWGLTESGQKTTGRDLAVLPKVVVYDPELTTSLPPAVTGPSAVNALAHCVEAFYAPGANPVTSLLAEDGIRALVSGVVTSVDSPEDLQGRTDALYGACLAGASFAVAGSGIHHKICHALGGSFDLPHAETHTVVLPHAVAFNESWMPETGERVRRAMGLEGRGPSATAAQGLYDLSLRIGAPTSLAEIGMERAGIAEVIDRIVAAVPAGNPRPVDRAGVNDLLNKAFDGSRPGVEGVHAA